MGGAPMRGGEVRENCAGNVRGFTGLRWSESAPAVRMVDAATELVRPFSATAVRLTEFAAMPQLGMLSRVESASSTAVLVVPSVRMQGWSSGVIVATAVLVIVTAVR